MERRSTSALFLLFLVIFIGVTWWRGFLDFMLSLCIYFFFLLLLFLLIILLLLMVIFV